MGRAKRAGQWVQFDGWNAGRAWREPDGALTFYIRKQVQGRRYEVNTGASTIRAALKQLERFEADPDAYNPAGDPQSAPLELDNDLAKAFLAWSLNEKGNTKPWVRKQQLALAWWMERLRGVNLRRATLAGDVLPHLDRVTDKATKVRVLKAFYSWLRKERHEVKAAQDPTYGALVAPQAKPAQWKRSKVVPREHFLLVLEHLTSPWRDALHVQAGTGWHTSEVVRFAADGAIEPLPKAMRVENGAAGVLVCPLHKSGDTHRTAVSAEVLEAAKRLRVHGVFSREWYDRAVRAACAAVKRPDGEAGIPVFTPRAPAPLHGDLGHRGGRLAGLRLRLPRAQVARDHEAVLRHARGGAEGADAGLGASPSRFQRSLKAAPKISHLRCYGSVHGWADAPRCAHKRAPKGEHMSEVKQGDVVRLGIGDLRRRLNVHPATIARWCAAGTFPKPHHIGERRAWFLQEVETWEAGQAARPPSARSSRARLGNVAEGSKP